MQYLGQEAQRGHLNQAHRSYRALRLLESARWWLQTILNENELDPVYQTSETTRQEFLCRIEELTRATTPGRVEAVYMEMIRSYP
jgi:hypothetical protein